jgi:hypothetical protein
LELNARQQHYLELIFFFDQEEEKANRAAWNQGFKTTPASIWRWIKYNPSSVSPSPLYLSLLGQGLVDNSTGSTFQALVQPGLIEYRTTDPASDIFEVQLTRAGRKFARELTGVKAKQVPSMGILKDYQWEALTEAYNADATGLRYYSRLGRYGNFKWSTVWLKLRDYRLGGKAYPLVSDESGVLRLTEQGKEFYLENLEKYKELYPELYEVSSSDEVLVNDHSTDDMDLAQFRAMMLAVAAAQHQPTEDSCSITNKTEKINLTETQIKLLHELSNYNSWLEIRHFSDLPDDQFCDVCLVWFEDWYGDFEYKTYKRRSGVRKATFKALAEPGYIALCKVGDYKPTMWDGILHKADIWTISQAGKDYLLLLKNQAEVSEKPVEPSRAVES